MFTGENHPRVERDGPDVDAVREGPELTPGLHVPDPSGAVTRSGHADRVLEEAAADAVAVA
jgi:hypothetical protein